MRILQFFVRCRAARQLGFKRQLMGLHGFGHAVETHRDLRQFVLLIFGLQRNAHTQPPRLKLAHGRQNFSDRPHNDAPAQHPGNPAAQSGDQRQRHIHPYQPLAGRREHLVLAYADSHKKRRFYGFTAGLKCINLLRTHRVVALELLGNARFNRRLKGRIKQFFPHG